MCSPARAGNIILFRKDQMDVIADESNPFNQMRVIISMDPPDHRTFRKVASGFFTPRGITRLDEIVTDTATLMMDRLAEHGDEPVDFVELVAQRHPLRVLCTILGVPGPMRIACLNSPRSCSLSMIPTSGAPARIGSPLRRNWAWSSSPCSTRSSRTGAPTPRRPRLAARQRHPRERRTNGSRRDARLLPDRVQCRPRHDPPLALRRDGGVPRSPRGVRSTQGRPR